MPDHVKVATIIKITEPGNSQYQVETETRIVATDKPSRRTFGRYWRLVYPGSALIRIIWLRAIKRKAELSVQ